MRIVLFRVVPAIVPRPKVLLSKFQGLSTTVGGARGVYNVAICALVNILIVPSGCCAVIEELAGCEGREKEPRSKYESSRQHVRIDYSSTEDWRDTDLKSSNDLFIYNSSASSVDISIGHCALGSFLDIYRHMHLFLLSLSIHETHSSSQLMERGHHLSFETPR